jgi:hypothetical protein
MPIPSQYSHNTDNTIFPVLYLSPTGLFSAIFTVLLLFGSFDFAAGPHVTMLSFLPGYMWPGGEERPDIQAPASW